jgi:hypothetical protein
VPAQPDQKVAATVPQGVATATEPTSRRTEMTDAPLSIAIERPPG